MSETRRIIGMEWDGSIPGFRVIFDDPENRTLANKTTYLKPQGTSVDEWAVTRDRYGDLLIEKDYDDYSYDREYVSVSGELVPRLISAIQDVMGRPLIYENEDGE